MSTSDPAPTRRLTPREKLALKEAATASKGKGGFARSVDAGTGRFTLGVVLASVAALLGIIIWLAILWFAQREFGLAAWGLGAMVGGAMLLGYGRGSTTAGLVAGGIALVMLICVKLVTAAAIIFWLQGIENAVGSNQAIYDPVTARDELSWMMIDDVHAEAGRDYNVTTDDEDYDAALEAEELAAAVPDDELELVWKQQHVASLRFTDVGMAALDDLDGDVDEPASVPYEDIQREANNMTLAELNAEIAAWKPASSGVSFGSALGSQFSPFDILWTLLAVGSAFRIALADGN